MSDKDLTEYRIGKLEEIGKENSKLLVDLAKSLAVLQTRVYFIGIGIATFVSFVVPLVRDILQG